MLYLEGVEKSLYDKKKEDGRHIVSLVDAGGVADFGGFFSDFYFNLAVAVEFLNVLYNGGGSQYLSSIWHSGQQ